MKLARKITLAIAVAILAVMAAHGYMLARRQVKLFDADLERSVQLKRALRSAVLTVWRTHGTAEAQRLVEETVADATGLRFRWTWLDAPPGDPRHLDLPAETVAQLHGGERVIFFRRDEGQEPSRYTYVPLSIEGSRPAVIEVVESIGYEHSFINVSRLHILVATIVILALCAAAVYALGVFFVARPIERLRDKARAVGAGDFGPPLALRQRDEIGELGRELDAMCDQLAEARRRLAEETEARIAAIDQMRHTDRLTTMGQLASGVAHELGTPLSVIAGRAEMIASGEVPGERVPASARIILEQAHGMTALIRQLLDFSRRQGPRFGLASLRAIGARAVDMLASFARKRGATLALDADDDPMLVSADEHQIQQALTNVIMNGIQAMPNGGRVSVSIGVRRIRPPDDATPEGDYLCATVTDEGQGIPPENQPRIFEPFFTTKGVGEGTGLGLSVAYGIVRDHGGWIDIASEPGKGSRFSLFLPRAADTRTRPAEVG